MQLRGNEETYWTWIRFNQRWIRLLICFSQNSLIDLECRNNEAWAWSEKGEYRKGRDGVQP